MRVRPRTRMQMHGSNDLNRWTVSFADFMTLMFAVFVVLYAVSASQEKKYQDVMQSIQNASQLLNQSLFSSYHEGILTHDSNIIIDNAGSSVVSSNGVKQADNELSDVDIVKIGANLQQLKSELEAQFSSELGGNEISLDLDGDWLTIEMGGSLLFVGGSHSLLISAKQQINKLASVLKPVNNMLRIRGYTDQDNISNEIYLSNWELAGSRAFSVLHELNRQGIVGKRMVMEAYGKHSPIIDSKGNVDKLNSRRVVIAISKYALVETVLSDSLDSAVNTNKKINSPVPTLVKPDNNEIQELHLPNNRLIITTRQE